MLLWCCFFTYKIFLCKYYFHYCYKLSNTHYNNQVDIFKRGCPEVVQWNIFEHLQEKKHVMGSLFNPNKAGFFEGSFSWRGGINLTPLLIFQEKLF